MDLELSGRTAAVIGGSSGIGAAVAELLAQEGCDVAVTYRDSPAGAAEVARAVRGQGRRAWVAQLDVADLHAVPAAARALATETGGPPADRGCGGW
jgi:NAD(P)-dependent dehydrogenase (short-subunit alcohol dehydrogenase family)